jgi:hypothetical protein
MPRMLEMQLLRLLSIGYPAQKLAYIGFSNGRP